MENMTDACKVLNALKLYPGISLRYLAAHLGWIDAKGKADSVRVHLCLVKLALDGKVIWTRGKHLHNHRWKALP